MSHPELPLDNIAEFPNTGPYHGHKGLRRWWQDVAVQLTIGRFRHTGIPIDNRWASLYWVRDGKIVRAVGYPSERRALKATGLRE